MNPQLLQDFPFFEHLDDEYLAEITKVCGERTYIKGESIFLRVKRERSSIWFYLELFKSIKITTLGM
ncbi:hypothetical protein [Paenibacillus odorifer]|uniref:hypothetical protein n=1 Tax=Paenibacillus TaxID=44249 RepID=UPI001FD08249|nr:hypothetical protein [Paenibacillus odorifer]